MFKLVMLSVWVGDYFLIVGFSGFGKLIMFNFLGLFDCLSVGEYWFVGVFIGDFFEDEWVVVRVWFIGFVF